MRALYEVCHVFDAFIGLHSNCHSMNALIYMYSSSASDFHCVILSSHDPTEEVRLVTRIVAVIFMFSMYSFLMLCSYLINIFYVLYDRFHVVNRSLLANPLYDQKVSYILGSALNIDDLKKARCDIAQSMFFLTDTNVSVCIFSGDSIQHCQA